MADRYISEKALIEEIAKIPDLRKLSLKTVGIAISATTTADVVEVVRCKDCKHLLEEKMICLHSGNMIFRTGKPTFHNYFCGYGERRKNENDRA